MARSERVQRLLLTIGLLVSALLLIRFAIDFSAEMPALLSMSFWLLVGASLCVVFANLYWPAKNVEAWRPTLIARLLVASIPIGFLASSLDCTGLSAQGCTPFCTFIKIVWVPIIAITCAIFLFVTHGAFALIDSTRKRVTIAGDTLRLALTLMIFVPLVPHCVCYNVGNGWWIDRIGASPVCYAWGFSSSVIALSALQRGARLRLSLFVCSAIICGSLAFFLGHHYLHIPW